MAYHRAIADATGMPMVLFQLQPMLGGVLYPPEVLDGLLGHPGGGGHQGGVVRPAALARPQGASRRGAAAHHPAHRQRQLHRRIVPAGRPGRAPGVRHAAHAAARGAPGRGGGGRHRHGPRAGGRIQRLADVIFAPPVADYRARTKEALTMMGVDPLRRDPTAAPRHRCRRTDAGAGRPRRRGAAQRLSSRIAGSARPRKSNRAWFSHALPCAGSRDVHPLPGTAVQVASQ